MSGKYWNPSSSPAKTILHRLNVSASCLASVLANRHPQQSYLGSDSAGLARLSLGRRQQLCWYREPSMSGLRAGSRLDSERAGPRWATASCAGGEERGRGCRLGDGRRLSFRWWEGSRDARAPPEGQRESARERESILLRRACIHDDIETTQLDRAVTTVFLFCQQHLTVQLGVSHDAPPARLAYIHVGKSAYHALCEPHTTCGRRIKRAHYHHNQYYHFLPPLQLQDREPGPCAAFYLCCYKTVVAAGRLGTPTSPCARAETRCL